MSDSLVLNTAQTTLCEAQRIKLAHELGKREGNNALYILDEPTTGLHFDDINKLMVTLKRLVQKGNTVVVIEHNLDVIKNCQYLVDLGPEGGAEGNLVFRAQPKIFSRSKLYTINISRNILTTVLITSTHLVSAPLPFIHATL
jgi:excinuclease UvrABC ATPase subunit